MERSTLNSRYRNYRTFCHVCLSRDRQLFSVEKYADIFQNICENKNLYSQPLLCWECTAMLRRIKQFKDKVELSTKILNKYVNGLYHAFGSLSNLKITEIDSIVIFKNLESDETKADIELEDIVNSHNNDQKLITDSSLEEDKSLIDIKQEFIDDNNSFEDELYDNNADNVENNESHLDATSENSSKTCKEVKTNGKRKPKNKQYRIVSNEIRAISSLFRKIRLTTEEVNTYMERERLNELYAAFKCDLCVCSWNSEKGLVEHNKKFHVKSAGKYQCDICLSRFKEKNYLALHLRRHCFILECNFCSYRSYRKAMKRHLKCHNKRIECIQCKAIFSNIYLFQQHYKDLHVMYICDVCGKKTKSKRILEQHISRHYETFECKLCDRRYKTRTSFKRHQEDKHAPQTDDTYCVQCDKTFSSASIYRRHITSSSAHSAERNGGRESKKVPCPDCGRLYSRKVYMTNHYRHVHMKQSKYYCEQCSKHFLNRTRYIDHMKYNHEGVKKEKNKLCNICGRGFTANRTLINHIRTHSGERPFECLYCSARFIQKQAMLSHVNHIHLKNKRPNRWQ